MGMSGARVLGAMPFHVLSFQSRLPKAVQSGANTARTSKFASCVSRSETSCDYFHGELGVN